MHSNLKPIEDNPRALRLFAVWCARRVQHIMEDPRSLAALDVAERYANGLATEAELSAAHDAAVFAYAASAPASTVAYAASAAAAAAYGYAPYWAARALARSASYVSDDPDGRSAIYDAALAAEGQMQAIELQRVIDCINAGKDPYP